MVGYFEFNEWTYEREKIMNGLAVLFLMYTCMATIYGVIVASTKDTIKTDGLGPVVPIHIVMVLWLIVVGVILFTEINALQVL